MSMVTYVGLDVHLNSIAAVWGRAKEKPGRLIVPNDPGGLAELRKEVGPGPVWAVYEASGVGFGVYDELLGWGWKASVLAPHRLPSSTRTRKTKTDLRDAARLWEVVLSHGELGTELPEVWVPDGPLRRDRELIRRRLTLAEDVVRVKNRITSLLRIHKRERPAALRTPWTLKHVAWLKAEVRSLGREVGAVLSSLVRELEFVKAEIRALDAEVEALSEESRYRPAVGRMTELDGVGTLTAMTFLVELGRMSRFGNRRKVASFLGLVPSCYESGDAADRKGRITRMGPSRVRKMLNQAAWILIRKDPRWGARYGPIAGRSGAKVAIVAMMRLLGIELWHRAGTA